MDTKTYSTKSNARRAARKQGLVEGSDFNLDQTDEGRWFLRPVEDDNTPTDEEIEAEKTQGRKYVRTGKYSDAFSEFGGVVAYVHERLSALAAAGEMPETRKELIEMLRAEGVNRNTANTQLQRWSAKRRG